MIIVCFSSVAWDGLWQRHQQIMSRLAKKGHKIIFIEPTNVLQGIKKPNLFLNRIEEKDGVVLVRPLYFPLHHKIKLLEKIDYLITSKLLNSVLKTLGVKCIDVMWSFSPYFYFATSAIKSKILVYDCGDESEGFYSSETAKKWILMEETNILKKSNMVFVTSTRLYQRCIKLNSNVYLAPNGVPSAFFEGMDKISIPDDIEKIKHPIIGYTGSLMDRLDYEMIYDAATRNEHISFVFVGQIITNNHKLKDLLNLNNVHYLGFKKYQEIPAYIHQFDVCLIPFNIQSLTLSAQPIKLLEYFALGKPVISTKLDEVEKFGELVYIANGDNFSDQIKKAAHENNKELYEKRKCVAKERDWDKIVDHIECILCDGINPP